MLAKAIFKIVELYGGIQLTYSTTSVGVVNSSELFERLEYCVEELIYVLGFDIFGKNGTRYALSWNKANYLDGDILYII